MCCHGNKQNINNKCLYHVLFHSPRLLIPPAYFYSLLLWVENVSLNWSRPNQIFTTPPKSPSSAEEGQGRRPKSSLLSPSCGGKKGTLKKEPAERGWNKYIYPLGKKWEGVGGCVGNEELHLHNNSNLFSVIYILLWSSCCYYHHSLGEEKLLTFIKA